MSGVCAFAAALHGCPPLRPVAACRAAVCAVGLGFCLVVGVCAPFAGDRWRVCVVQHMEGGGKQGVTTPARRGPGCDPAQQPAPVT